MHALKASFQLIPARIMASLNQDDATSSFDVATSLFIQCRMAHQELQAVASKEGKLLNRDLEMFWTIFSGKVFWEAHARFFSCAVLFVKSTNHRLFGSQ